MTQGALAKAVHVGPSAVAQWELPHGTSPTIEHLSAIAVLSGVTFEWLATGRGPVALTDHETPAIDATSFATDQAEDRLLTAFRRVPSRRRETFVRWMEDFFASPARVGRMRWRAPLFSIPVSGDFEWRIVVSYVPEKSHEFAG